MTDINSPSGLSLVKKSNLIQDSVRRIINNGIKITGEDLDLTVSLTQYIYKDEGRTILTAKSILEQSIENEYSCFSLRKFHWLKLLRYAIPKVGRLEEIPQNKRKGIDVLEHSFLVVNEVEKMFGNNTLMKYVALFHDLGKFDTYDPRNDKLEFYEHEYLSLDIARQLIDRYSLMTKPEEKYVLNIIRNHMSPLQYQRTPNWTLSAINRFVNRCDGNYKDVINFAKCDKLAAGARKEYLKPLDELMSKCSEV